MLGRYIAGTLMVLGVAMIAAPESPDRADEIAVARTETSPAALETAAPAEMAAAMRDAPQAPIVPAAVSTKSFETGVEAALAEALALDATEAAAEPDLLAVAATAQDTASTAEVPVALASTGVAAPEPAANLDEPPARVLFVTGNKVNVRAGPSTQYRVVGSVTYGEPVQLVAFEGDGWARIRFEDGGTSGFMARRFLVSELAGG